MMGTAPPRSKDRRGRSFAGTGRSRSGIREIAADAPTHVTKWDMRGSVRPSAVRITSRCRRGIVTAQDRGGIAGRQPSAEETRTAQPRPSRGWWEERRRDIRALLFRYKMWHRCIRSEQTWFTAGSVSGQPNPVPVGTARYLRQVMQGRRAKRGFELGVQASSLFRPPKADVEEGHRRAAATQSRTASPA